MRKSPYKRTNSLKKRLARLVLLLLFFSAIGIFLLALTSCSADSTEESPAIPTEAKFRPLHRRFVDISVEETSEVEVIQEIPLTGEALYNSYVHEICELYYPNVDPYLIRSMIEQESSYRPDVIGDSGRSYGLMQIQPRWNQERMDRLGVTDLLDPYSNLLVGIDLVSGLLESSPTVEYALMSYNGGPDYAHRLYAQGKVSGYASEVLARFYILKGGA